MIAVLQRVSQGNVFIDNKIVGSINHGLVIFLGVMNTDEKKDGDFLADKIADFRIFNDKDHKMNLSVKDAGGSALVISQFTLCSNWRKGRRPSFINAASPEKGEQLYIDFMERLTANGLLVKSGRFGAIMEVNLINDGPVTFVLDSKKV
jgi:D-tyrosyl-tRNA(Tyr) deacylase